MAVGPLSLYGRLSFVLHNRCGLWEGLTLKPKVDHTSLMAVVAQSKREVPRDVRNSKVRRQDKFRRDWSRH